MCMCSYARTYKHEPEKVERAEIRRQPPGKISVIYGKRNQGVEEPIAALFTKKRLHSTYLTFTHLFFCVRGQSLI